jgi:hypothetical protein
VSYLDAQIKAGLAVPFSWATAELDGKVYRVNGQHSSNVLANLNGAIPEGLSAHVDHYQVKDMTGLVLLFRQFDPRQSARKPKDVARAYQGCVEAIRDVPPDAAKLAVEGVAWYLREVEEAEHVSVGDDVYDLFNVEDYHQFIIWIGGLLSIKTPELKRPPIVAAMYATFEKDSEDARDFWQDVSRGGDQYNDKAPSTVVDAWFKALHNGHRPDGVKSAQIYQACVFAWNAYRNDKTFDKVKWDTRKGFFEID